MLSDKARIVTSTAFRRLQTKAQVFSLEKNAAILAKVLPQARLEVLEGYGHLPEVEAPDLVNRMLRQFFAE